MKNVKTVTLLLICLIASLRAYDDSPSCFRDLEKNYFKRDIVFQAFSLYQVNRSSWNPIMRKLDDASKDVPAEIRKISRRMSPDPIENPFEPQEAQKLLLQVLYQTFYQVLSDTQVESLSNIQGMFNYIRSRQQTKLDACFPPPPKA